MKNVSFTANPLTPDIAAQQMALQQRQAMASAMMQQGSQPIDPMRTAGKYVVPISPLEGLSHAGQAIAAALMQKDINQQQLALGQQQYGRMRDAFGLPSAQSQPSTPPADAPQQAAPWVDPDSGQVAPGQPMPGPASLPPAQSPQGSPPQQGGQGNGGILTLPGHTPEQSMQLYYVLGPEAYSKMLSDAISPTPEMKNYTAAFGNTPQGHQMFANAMMNEHALNMRPGGTVMLADGRMMTAPQNGIQTNWGPNGPVSGAVPGFADALRGNAAANAAGRAQYQPVSGFDENGTPTYTTALNVANQSAPAATRAPAAPTRMASPPPGAASGGPSPANNQPVENIPTGGSVQPNLPATPVTPVTSGTIRPALAPGQVEARQGEAKAAIDRDSLLRQQVQGSNERMNAIDNMIDLSKTNTKFGPGAGAKTFWEGVANQVPGIDVGKSDIENYQVFKKFSSNLASQYQKALGGTGTDAQLQNTLDSVTSPEQLNQVIPKVGSYLKSLEATAQININARDKALADNANYPGTDAQKLIKVEGELRKNLDPRIVQMQQMTPQDAAAYYSNLPKDQQAALKNKIQFVHQKGWIE